MSRVAVFLIITILFNSNVTPINGFIDPITGGIAIGIASIIGYGINKLTTCNYNECCNADYIPQDLSKLRVQLRNNLFGQEIAQGLILNALNAHIIFPSRKPLVMSFHGPPGTGKNFVSGMIVNTFLKNREKSQYFLFFKGRTDFKQVERLHEYQEKLTKAIREQLIKCPKSIILFDEVDKMIPGLLDVVVRFIDYGPMDIDNTQAIFIFISNKGSNEISNILIDLWNSGKSRYEAKLSDFERIISLEAFNVRGGFYMSDTISSSLIDHFIPFLPLEQKHVEQCIKKEFKDRHYNPTDEQINEVLEYTTFEPPNKIYAQSGCKNIISKVLSIILRDY